MESPLSRLFRTSEGFDLVGFVCLLSLFLSLSFVFLVYFCRLSRFSRRRYASCVIASSALLQDCAFIALATIDAVL